MDNSYKKLDVYIRSKALVGIVYKMIAQFPEVEKFALANQLQRSVISVPSNIAEGLSRSAVKEQCHFLDIAFGSLMEVDCQLEIARDLDYITEEEYSHTYKEIYDISKMLIRLKSVRQNQSSKKQTDIR